MCPENWLFKKRLHNGMFKTVGKDKKTQLVYLLDFFVFVVIFCICYA